MNAAMFLTTPPAEPKPGITRRFASLLGKVAALSQTEAQASITSYSQLVDSLVECEIDGSKTMPSAESIRAICEAAGVTVEELNATVEIEIRRQEIIDELTGEQAAKDKYAGLRQREIDHKAQAERTVSELQREGDLIAEQLRAQSNVLDTFSRLRSELASLGGGPSEQEIEMTERIKILRTQEATLRLQVSSERFIGSTIEESATYREHAELAAQIAELESAVRTNNGSGLSREDFHLRRLLPKLTELERKIQRERGFYVTGAKIARLRAEAEDLSRKRDQFRADRLAMLGGS